MDVISRLFAIMRQEAEAAREALRQAGAAMADRASRMRALAEQIARMNALMGSRRDDAQTQSAAGLASMDLQNNLQISSATAEAISNISKQDHAAKSDVIRNMRGSESPAASWRLAAGLVLIGLIGFVATAAFIGARHYYGGRPFILTPVIPLEPLDPRAGAPPPAQIVPLPASTSSCDVEFIAPVDGQEISVDGPLEIEWNAVPEAASYALELRPPPGAGASWVIETEETSKRFYMDNFPLAGDYELILIARGYSGEPLCSTDFAFFKDQLLLADSGGTTITNPQGAGAGAAPGASLEITPTWDPADDTVDYGGCPGCDDGGDPIVK